MERCISLTKPNWLTTLLTMLKPSRSSTLLLTTALTESVSITSYEEMKSLCQSLWNADDLVQSFLKVQKPELGAWPTGDRKPPPRGNTRRRGAHFGCPKMPRRTEALPRCSFLLPPCFLLHRACGNRRSISGRHRKIHHSQAPPPNSP